MLPALVNLRLKSALRTEVPMERAAESVFWPIGNSGWYQHGEDKAPYDQQPVEAVTMAEAAFAAFGMFGDEKYLATFRRAHRPSPAGRCSRRTASQRPSLAPQAPLRWR